MTENLAAYAKLPDGLGRALRRLTAALDLLDAARERRAEADSLRANLEEELGVMRDDWAKLAVELDSAAARTKTLELANDEVTRRLAHASAEIREVLTELAARQD